MSLRYDGHGVTCPSCDSGMNRVFDSRPHQGTMRRRRECRACGFRWTTMEIACDSDCLPSDERYDAIRFERGDLIPKKSVEDALAEIYARFSEMLGARG